MNKSKKITLLSAAFVAVILLVAGTAYAADAWSQSPEGVEAWDLGNGMVCVTDYRGTDVYGKSPHTVCYCPCDTVYVETIIEVPGDCEECEIEPTPDPEKIKCNSGRGNGSEGDPDCDPGNSGGHNQGGD